MKIFILIIQFCLVYPETLQEAFDEAGPYENYEKYVILESVCYFLFSQHFCFFK